MEKDYLTEDTLIPENQNFMCISFLSDVENKLSLKGVKVRGSFKTLEEAQDHAKKLQSIDQAHNVFVGEVGKWVAFNPDVNSKEAGDPEYANEQLNKMMKEYNKNQEQASLVNEERKFKDMQKNIEESIDVTNTTMDELKQQLLETTDDKEITDLNKKLSNIDERLKELTSKKEDIVKSKKKISKKLEKSLEKNTVNV
jgi:mevalonate kinase